MQASVFLQGNKCVSYLRAIGAIMVLSTVMLIAQAYPEVLQYHRAKLAQGELWRLVTGHFTHSNFNHLCLNLMGLGLWAILQPKTLSLPKVLSLSLFLALIISLLFWVLNPHLQWYVGYSGVLYSLFGAWVFYLIGNHEYFTALVFGLALMGKTFWDALYPDSLSQQLIAVPVVYQAHWYGLLLSPLSAFWLYRRPSTMDTKASGLQND